MISMFPDQIREEIKSEMIKKIIDEEKMNFVDDNLDDSDDEIEDNETDSLNKKYNPYTIIL